MITVISATNRPDSNTEIFAKYYYRELKKKAKVEVKFLSLLELNELTVPAGMYDADKQHEKISELQDKFMLPADRFVIVSPEYNGSFPGILKYFLDAISIRKYKETFRGKNALLVGVSTGRAGNLRGLGHLAHILLHVGTHVHPAQMPFSKVGELIEKGKLSDKETRKAVREHISGWIEQ